jgi:hypothetical protein
MDVEISLASAMMKAISRGFSPPPVLRGRIRVGADFNIRRTPTSILPRSTRGGGKTVFRIIHRVPLDE